jgi:anthranilate synthase component 1
VSYQTRLLYSRQNRHPDEAVPGLCRFNQYNPQRYPYLLSSTASRQNNTQYDILIACPLYRVTLNADKTIHYQDLLTDSEKVTASSGFLDTLEKLFQQNKQLPTENSRQLPFTGGWFVYLSYEMAEEIESCLSLPALPENQPLAVAARCPAAIIHDKSNNRLIALAEEKYAYLLDDLEQDYLSLCHDAVGDTGPDKIRLSNADNFFINFLCEIFFN